MQPLTGLDPSQSLQSVTGCPEFDYAPGQPNLYLMMRRKQELARLHGVAGGFEAFCRQFNLPSSVQIRPVTLDAEKNVAARQGSFFRETAQAGERFVHLPPPVTGDGNHRPLHAVTRSHYVACLENARLRGRSAIVELPDSVLLDYQDDELTRLDDELDWDPAIFCADETGTWLVDDSDAGAIEVGEAFNLLGAHTDFFGHWMCEYLPKYMAAGLTGFLPQVPVLIDAAMPRSHRESLELLYGHDVHLIEVPAFKSVHVEKLWCAPALSYQPLHERRNERFSWDAIAAPPARFAPVIREMQRRLCLALGESSGAARIYLARKSFRHRRLLNGAAIEEAARELGFEVIYPEDLPFRDQATMVRNARLIVAPEGSALFLSMFCRPGTKVCILSHPLTDVLADYNGLLTAHGIEVFVVTGPISRTDRGTPHNSDYSVDVRTFRRELAGV